MRSTDSWRGEGRRTYARETGFTLIEVLAAVLIVSLVFGLLLESVTRNLADLGRARAEARAAQLAENRLRDLRAGLETGEKLEDGVKEGVFEEPDSDLHWQITVVPQTLTLPADYKGELPPSPLFDAPNERAPKPPPTAGQEPPLRMVQVRVFTADQDPESVDPYIVLVTAQPDSARLQQLQQQNPLNQKGAKTQTPPLDPNTETLPGMNPWQNPGR